MAGLSQENLTGINKKFYFEHTFPWLSLAAWIRFTFSYNFFFRFVSSGGKGKNHVKNAYCFAYRVFCLIFLLKLMEQHTFHTNRVGGEGRGAVGCIEECAVHKSFWISCCFCC